MRFFVSEIRSAGHLEQSTVLDPAVVLGEPQEFMRFNYPLNATVKASLSSSDILVCGHVATTVGFVCARCLENFDRLINVDFQQVFALDLQEFDVTNDIREAIYIDLPLTPVCKENCQGLCVSCGKNKNSGSCTCKINETAVEGTLSKWDALKEFRSQIKRS